MLKSMFGACVLMLAVGSGCFSQPIDANGNPVAVASTNDRISGTVNAVLAGGKETASCGFDKQVDSTTTYGKIMKNLFAQWEGKNVRPSVPSSDTTQACQTLANDFKNLVEAELAKENSGGSSSAQ